MHSLVTPVLLAEERRGCGYDHCTYSGDLGYQFRSGNLQPEDQRREVDETEEVCSGQTHYDEQGGADSRDTGEDDGDGEASRED